MTRHHWYVWDDADKVLCEGSHAKCLSFYMHCYRTHPDIRLGYIIQ